MIKVEITSTEVMTKNGISKVGKPYTIREQSGFAHLVGKDGQAQKYPQGIRVNLEDDQAAFPVGMYELAASSLYVGKFGQLAIGRIQLRALTASAMRSAA
jgi:hypothetical protein